MYSSSSSQPAKEFFSSAILLAASSSEIPHLRKQLIKVLSGSVFHALENHMTERIEITGIEAFFSKLDINLLTTKALYFAFSEGIILYSMGCVTEVALSGTNINSTRVSGQGAVIFLVANFDSPATALKDAQYLKWRNYQGT